MHLAALSPAIFSSRLSFLASLGSWADYAPSTEAIRNAVAQHGPAHKAIEKWILYFLFIEKDNSCPPTCTSFLAA